MVCNLFGPNKKMFAPRAGSPNSFLKKLPTSIVKKKTDHEKINTKKNTHKDTYHLRCTRKRIHYIPLEHGALE